MNDALLRKRRRVDMQLAAQLSPRSRSRSRRSSRRTRSSRPRTACRPASRTNGALYRRAARGDEEMGYEVRDDPLEALLKEFDADRSSALDLLEFTALMARLLGYRELPEEQFKTLRKVFRYINTDGDGKITPAELRAVVERFGLRMAASQLEMYVTEFDAGYDGLIDLQEFGNLMSSSTGGSASDQPDDDRKDLQLTVKKLEQIVNANTVRTTEALDLVSRRSSTRPRRTAHDGLDDRRRRRRRWGARGHHRLGRRGGRRRDRRRRAATDHGGRRCRAASGRRRRGAAAAAAATATATPSAAMGGAMPARRSSVVGTGLDAGFAAKDGATNAAPPPLAAGGGGGAVSSQRAADATGGDGAGRTSVAVLWVARRRAARADARGATAAGLQGPRRSERGRKEGSQVQAGARGEGSGFLDAEDEVNLGLKPAAPRSSPAGAPRVALAVSPHVCPPEGAATPRAQAGATHPWRQWRQQGRRRCARPVALTKGWRLAPIAECIHVLSLRPRRL